MSKWSEITKLLFCTTCFLFFLMPPAFGEDNPGPEILESFLEQYSPQIDINVRWASFQKDSELDPEDYRLSGNATLKFTKELIDGIVLRIDPRINFDSVYTNSAQFFIEDNIYRPTYTFNEALISIYGDSFEIEVGKKIFSWKVADGFSPIDNLNPVDMLELLDPEKIGIPALSVTKMFDIADIQLVFLPWFIPDRKIDDTSRWYSDDPAARAAFKKKYPLLTPINVDVGREFPDDGVDGSSIAAKISSSTLLEGWDLSLVYRSGYDTRGVIKNELGLLMFPQVYINQTTVYPEYKMYGMSFSTVIGDFELHGEGVFHDTKDTEKDEDYFSYIAGINYTTYDLLSILFDEVRLVLEFAGEKVHREREEDSIYSNMGLMRGLTSDIISSVEFKINEDHSFKVSYIYNTGDEDSLFEAAGESRLNDYLKFIYGYQRLNGDSDTFFGQWDENDRYYVRMSITY